MSCSEPRAVELKILHVIVDDKFTEGVQKSFSAVFPGRSRYWITGPELSSGSSASPRVGGAYSELTRLVPLDQYRFTAPMKEDLEWCTMLIVHYLTPLASLAIQRVRANTVVVWSGWGADYYSRILSAKKLYLPETARLVLRSPKARRKAMGIRRRVLSRIYLRDWEERAFRRVDFFSSPIPGDYDRLRERLPQLRARYTQLNYGSVEATIDVGPKSITGSNILVGNSADWANNHAEAFLSLRGVDLGSGKLVVPLSYGDPACREAVIKLGSATFGDRFAPVLELLPLEKYHELIATCAVAVMNHVRQQALGNVEAMLFKGARVFVRPESPVYSFLRERGACIGDASKIEGAGGSLFEPLTADERLRNRRVVESFWGQDVVLGNIAALGSLRRTGAARP